MSQNNVKGHGTIKKLRTGAVVSVLALGVAGVVSTGGTVSADEVVSSSVTAIENPNYVAPVAEAPTNEVPTTEQVANAQSDANQATQKALAQGVVVEGLKSELADAQGVVSSTQGEITEVEKVTPEVVDSAKAESDSASDALAKAQDAVSSAQGSLADAESKVTAQESVVSDAQSSVDSLSKKVESLSDGTNIDELEANVKNLEDKVAVDQSNVDNAKNALEAAKLAETNKAQAIEDQKAVVASAESVVDSTAKGYSEAIEAQKATQSAEDSAKKDLDTAKAGTKVTETVKTGETTTTTASGARLKNGIARSSRLRYDGVFVNQDYIDAVKALANGTGSVDAVKDAIAKGRRGVALDTLAGVSASEFTSWNEQMGWSFSNTDDSTRYLVSELSDSQLEDLSLFYVALVNDVRSKVGSPLLTVTSDSLAEAKRAVRDVFNLSFPHYKGMNNDQRTANGFWGTTSSNSDTLVTAGRVPSQDALSSLDGKYDTVVLNSQVQASHFSNNDGRRQTMKDLKLNILSVVGAQLFGTQGTAVSTINSRSNTQPVDFEQALRVLGLKGSATTAGVGLDFMNTYQGMVYRAPQTVTTLGNANGVAIYNPYLELVDPVTTTTPIYETVTKTIVDEAKVAEAQSVYDQAKSANDSAKSVMADKEAQYSSAQDAFISAQRQLNDLINGTANIPALEKAVSDAESTLAEDTKSLEDARNTLSLAKASSAERIQALEEAKSQLSDAQVVLAEAREVLEVLTKSKNVASVALADAKSKQATAQSAFDSASAKYRDLSAKLANKDSVLASLNAKLAEAQAKVDDLTAKLATAEADFVTLRNDANAKQAEYLRLASLRAEAEGVKDEQRRQTLKDKADTITTQPGVTQVGDKTTYSRVERAKALPNTGTEESLLGLLGTSLIAGLVGYVGKRKRTR